MAGYECLTLLFVLLLFAMHSPESTPIRTERQKNFPAIFQAALMEYWIESRHPASEDERTALMLSWGSEEEDYTGYAEQFSALFKAKGDRLTDRDLNPEVFASWIAELDRMRAGPSSHARAA